VAVVNVEQIACVIYLNSLLFFALFFVIKRRNFVVSCWLAVPQASSDSESKLLFLNLREFILSIIESVH